MTLNQMTFDEIKKSLKARDVNFTDIANALEVSLGHVTNVARGSAHSKNVANAISLSLGKSLTEVFGNQYDGSTKRGPKDRTERKQVIYEALRNQKPVPAPHSMAQQ